MKISNILILLIFNGILWSLITSMENNENQKDLIEETWSKPKDKNKKSNDEAESSGKTEGQNEEPKPKINKNKIKGLFGREIGSKSNKFKEYYEEKEREIEREIERKKQEDERLEFIRRLSEICAVIDI
ncbi:unnamed protein product [Meloidogyne enterolobii]|uniref:Uncharacterized protein n=1 Tax=Meloidogyne enterolobii TaxID=390850 RepID=A0ACB0YEZ7_MELEN